MNTRRGSRGQRAQERVLLARQAHGPARPRVPRASRCRCESSPTRRGPSRRASRRRSTAPIRADDLAEVERLGDVVVGALGEAAQAVRGRATAAQDDHRQQRVEAADGALGGADLAKHVEPARVRQAQVEKQEVRSLVVAEPERVTRASAPAARR